MNGKHVLIYVLVFVLGFMVSRMIGDHLVEGGNNQEDVDELIQKIQDINEEDVDELKQKIQDINKEDDGTQYLVLCLDENQNIKNLESYSFNINNNDKIIKINLQDGTFNDITNDIKSKITNDGQCRETMMDGQLTSCLTCFHNNECCGTDIEMMKGKLNNRTSVCSPSKYYIYNKL